MNTEKTFGSWKVDSDGDLVHPERGYDITSDRLDEKDWILHLSEKSWVNFNDFIPAYLYALSLAGISEVSIATQYQEV